MFHRLDGELGCVLRTDGYSHGGNLPKTTVAGPVTAPTPASRVALTWNGSTTAGAGIPFAWASLTAAEQTAIDSGDPNTPTGTPTGTTYQPYRVSYLLGDRTNEQNSSVPGLQLEQPFLSALSGSRRRAGRHHRLQPTWVGPPISGYPNTWVDKYDAGTMLENSGQTYGSVHHAGDVAYQRGVCRRQ